MRTCTFLVRQYRESCRENGAKVTKEQRDTGLAELKVFRDWVMDSVLKTDSITGFDAILIMPSGNGGPKYRDNPNK